MIKYALIFVCILFIQVSSAQQIINQNIYGFATSNTFSYFNIDDAFFQKKINEISPKVLRFPGGAVGNFYHFNRSAYGLDIKEIDSLISGKFPKRARGLISYSRKKGHKNNYIDDFIKLAKLTNASAVLVANVLTEDKEDILAMIRKIRENDIHIIGVELGSELSNKSYYDNGYTIDNYIKKTADLSKYIKQNFPELKTAVVAAPIISNKKHRHYIWNYKLSKLNFYDAIIVHSYAKVVKGKDQYGQMIDEKNEGDFSVSFIKYKDRIHYYFKNKYPQEINEYNLLFDNSPIWITEWNLQYSKKTGNTHLQGLFVANYFLELLSNTAFQNIDLTTFHNLAGRDFGGSVFQMKNNTTLIQSTFSPLRIVSNFFNNKEIYVFKEQISDDIYKYIFSNNEGVISICWVNWSEKMYNAKIGDSTFNTIEYCYAEELYSKNSDNQAIQYVKVNYKKNSPLSLKPYSLTLIK